MVTGEIFVARKLQELEDKIRSLSADDRTHLLHDLIADLDGAMESDVGKAWLEGAERIYNKQLIEDTHYLIDI
jgi:hypothetical protein